METALVTGAAGFIGSHLVEALLDRGYRVRALDDLSTGRRDNLDGVSERDAFRFVEGDVRDEATVERVANGVDRVFHLAARTSVPASVETPAETTSVNCTGTATVFAAAREHDARVVFASSAAVYGSDVPVPTPEDASLSPESPYALSKRYGERLAGAADVDAVSVRFFNVFGPRQDADGPYAAVIPAFVERMRAGQRPVIYGDGEQTRDFVFVGDVVDATVRAAEHGTPGGVYNVGSGGRVTITGLVEALNGVLGTDLDPVYDDPRPGDIRHSGADISRARADLDYEPTVGLREGLSETVAYWE
jgi:nucleoside-diphosphate-sugar epimerase